MKKYTTVADFLGDLDTKTLEQVSVLRDAVLTALPAATEHIKWNSPSYVLDGEDRVTFNLLNKEGVVKLILHMGARRQENKAGAPIMEDESGLISWNSDIRGSIAFRDLADLRKNLPAAIEIVRRWTAIPV